MQRENLLFGDFYAIWLSLKLELQDLKESKIVEEIVKSLEKREDKLLKNQVFKLALFLDPRYFFLLNNSEKSEARMQLKRLWKAYETIQNVSPVNSDQEPEKKKSLSKVEQFLQDKEGESTSAVSKLDSFLRRKSKEKTSAESQSTTKANLDIESFSMQREPVSTDILKYWDSLKHQHPYVYILAMIVLAVPSSQTSVERLFSSMNYVFSERRSTLLQDNLENILLVRSNYNFKIEKYIN